MTETPVPDAAAQIAHEAMGEGYGFLAPRVVAALARAGWLHDPAEMVTVDDDTCTYCGTPIPDHGLDCAHYLRVELAAARAHIAKLGEMAEGVDEVIAHYHEYDELDEPWLVETARRLREFAEVES